MYASPPVDAMPLTKKQRPDALDAVDADEEYVEWQREGWGVRVFARAKRTLRPF